MLRFHNYDIVFQEVPGEVTLAINISGCPHGCKGCHSPHLMLDTGEVLDEDALAGMLERYGNAITCVCFMGGDGDPKQVERLACFVRGATAGRLKTAWYSGCQTLPDNCLPRNFDFIKLGSYVEHLGGLDSPTTNQRFYQIENEAMIDITEKFQKLQER